MEITRAPHRKASASEGFRCTHCNAPNSAVVNTRPSNEYEPIVVMRRRRECVACGFRFTTYETDIKPTGMRDANAVRDETLDGVVKVIADLLHKTVP